MGIKRKAVTTYEEAMDQALRFLGVRFLSRSELRRKMAQKGIATELTERVERRLTELGYLDDTRLATEVLKSYMGAGKYSALYIREKMKQRGLSLDESFYEYDEMAVAKRLLIQRGWVYDDVDAAMDAEDGAEEKRQDLRYKAMKFLRNRGFSMHVIQSVCAEYL